MTILFFTAWLNLITEEKVMKVTKWECEWEKWKLDTNGFGSHGRKFAGYGKWRNQSDRGRSESVLEYDKKVLCCKPNSCVSSEARNRFNWWQKSWRRAAIFRSFGGSWSRNRKLILRLYRRTLVGTVVDDTGTGCCYHCEG